MNPTRSEKIAALAVVLVAVSFAAVLATGLADALGKQGWFSNGANVIQWVSGPGTFAVISGGLYAYWTRRCAVPWCPRHGEHDVDGTLEKVCAHHHTRAHHELVHDLHGDLHALSGRLGRGESHGRRAPRSS